MTLGITKIDTPAGFGVVESQSTFAYTPGPDTEVSAVVLDKNPPLLLSTELTENEPGEGDHPPTINAHNVTIPRYKSGGKTSVPIPGPDDQKLQHRAFRQICLYGYFVAE